MPELPDLQVFAGNLDKALAGKTLDNITLMSKKANAATADFEKALQHKKLRSVYREGKELYFDFGDHILALHLMLHGRLFLFDDKNEEKYRVVELAFKGGKGLALTDWQGAATPTLDPAENNTPDALGKKVTAEWWVEKLAKKKSAIKNVLLDQKFIRGIGNAYADEILYDAMISPFSVSNKIPQEAAQKLSKSVKKVLEDAEKQIKKARPDTISGEYRDFLNVHQPKKKETPKGEKILVEKGTRKTYYVEEQKMYPPTP